jgi:hypothetical protein
MACANRAEIVRKAILNCSTEMFDQSRSFVFHILSNKQINNNHKSFSSSLAALVDPIQMSNGSNLLFATFTTNKYERIWFHILTIHFYSVLSSSLTASAVCLFILDQQFYDVFTAPSKQINRRTSIINNEINELIRNCNQTISSTIDRDMVESEKQFLPYLSNPLLIETMSTYTFTSINVIQYDRDLYCLIIGTSKREIKLNMKILSCFIYLFR